MTGQIADFLRPGAENGVTLLGIDSRSVRRMIERERRSGVPILADNLHGYFLPGTADELRRCVHSMKHRAKEIEKSARAIERSGRALDTEQMRMDRCAGRVPPKQEDNGVRKEQGIRGIAAKTSI